MIYEYRCFDIAPGRVPEFTDRFGTVSLKFLERHGFDPVGFWLPEVGPSNQFHYLLRFESSGHREDAWRRYRADPPPYAAREVAATAEPLALKSWTQLWKPTNYSPLT